MHLDLVSDRGYYLPGPNRDRCGRQLAPSRASREPPSERVCGVRGRKERTSLVGWCACRSSVPGRDRDVDRSALRVSRGGDRTGAGESVGVAGRDPVAAGPDAGSRGASDGEAVDATSTLWASVFGGGLRCVLGLAGFGLSRHSSVTLRRTTVATEGYRIYLIKVPGIHFYYIGENPTGNVPEV